ncbi:hypothetical protein PYV61_06895, partial [Roseisolibacter sp. H3M3-2]
MLAAAACLRDPRELYLAAVAVATLGSVALAVRPLPDRGGRRRGRVALLGPPLRVAAALAFLVPAWQSQRAGAALDRDAAAVLREARDSALRALGARPAAPLAEADALALR